MTIAALKTVRRLGILGGTFDPIHYGHLVIAEEARLCYSLDAVLFIPTGEAPHKFSQQASAEQRFLLTSLATSSHPDFFVSRMEIERTGTSYTVDTLHTLHDIYPLASFYLLLGADSAQEFTQWRSPVEISQLATIVAATRPGFALDPIPLEVNGKEICYETLPIPALNLSSTALRQRVREGKSLRYLTPDAVANYVDKFGLYREA